MGNSSLMDMIQPTHKTLQRGQYQHFKGGMYRVLMVATDANTGEAVVVYLNAKGEPWTRPYDDFTGHVSREGYDGPRFQRVAALRSRVIHLAQEKPSLRPYLLPLLKETMEKIK